MPSGDNTHNEEKPDTQDTLEVNTPGHSTEKTFSKTPPILLREYVALIMAVIAADIALYHGGGFGGFAALFVAFTFILLLGSYRCRPDYSALIVAIMLMILAFRLFWLGSWISVILGMFLLGALSMTLVGLKPYVLETATTVIESIAGGGMKLSYYIQHIFKALERPRFSMRSLIFPTLSALIFGTIFIFANPVLQDFFEDVGIKFWKRLNYFIPEWTQMAFWFLVLWFTAGVLRLHITSASSNYFQTLETNTNPQRFRAAPQYFYASARNTLVVLIVLFTIYLIFEFYYLWFKPIPRGFRYSEYAHEGAAWLTFALALSTAVLGIIFYGGLREHPHLSHLKKLTWIWSAENFILALAAYHRTQIYVHYNGMSRMRVIAVVGIALVAVGFILVVIKVARNKSFVWMIRHHLIGLLIAIYLLAIIPVDYFVTKYNVQQIVSGNPAPSVQIAVHPISADGLLQLIPLLQSENVILREGIKALLARNQKDLEHEMNKRYPDKNKWTFYQMGKARAFSILDKQCDAWLEYLRDPKIRNEAFEKFKIYAMQWYD